MNKIYLSMILMVATLWASAQVTPRIHDANNTKLVSVDQNIAKIRLDRFDNTEKSTHLRWFFQPEAFAVFNANGYFEDYYSVTMFPDSTILGSGDPTDFVFQHSMAVSLHPSSEIFEEGAATDWNEHTNYTLDSIRLGYIYSRNTASSIVDTIVVQIQVNTWGYTLESSTYAWVQSIYGATTMRVSAILRDPLSYLASSPDANVIHTQKFPLIESDSASSPADFFMGLPSVLLNGGEVIKASFTFVPGYTWTPYTDSLQMYNEFSYLTFGNASVGTYPYYVEGDFNTNQGMRTWAYRDNTDDTYEPCYFFGLDAGGTPYPFQYHDVSFKLNALNVAVANVEEVMTVSQNRPNPFNGTTTIDYSLTNASKVSVAIYNVAGAQVMTISEGLKAAGNHNVLVDGSNLPAGVYYYTLTADNHSVTKKMIVY